MVKRIAVMAKLAASSVVFGFAFTFAAQAADTLRVGKAAANSFMFAPVNIGVAKGIFQANGLNIQIIDFNGSAKAHQAMAAGALDLLVGGGTDLSFIVRGSPEIGIAAISGSPDLGFIESYDSPLKTIDDLKGRKIGVSTAGSLTAWLANDLAQVKGWGPNGVVPVAIGNEHAGEIAAIKTKEVDAFIETNAFGYQLEEAKSGRLLAPTSDYVKDFVANAMFASNDIVKSNPDAVRRFVKAWFETIAFLRQNKAQAVPLLRQVTGYDEDVQNRDYDLTMPDMSLDGRFPPQAMKIMAKSFVQLKILSAEPDMSKLHTDRFLPSR